LPVPDTAPDRFARVALDVPMAQLGASLFDYAIAPAQAAAVVPGSWVVVPWGRGRRVGVVAGLSDRSEIDPARVKPLLCVLADAPVLPPSWFELVRFCGDYYHRGLGEVAIPAIPKLLRTPPAARARGSAFVRARERFVPAASTQAASQPPPLNDAQRTALDALRAADGFAVFLLHGITGSGKTEVYLHWLAEVLARDACGQVLLLVPEIALTPQLGAQVAARFPGHSVAVLHSDLADGDRAAHWLAAVEGRARVVIGTRLAVLAPLPALAAIVVDEEHDASYKQQEGVRYSARDLAIVAASQRKVPIALGSATPSLESWHAARRGRYRLLALPERVGGAQLPTLDRVDLRGRKLRCELAQESIDAIGEALARGEQALVFINRRGYAPVLACESCGWLSRCTDCSAYRVLHRIAATRPARYRLVCHHCSAEQPVPRACPDCGNVDLTALGRGTQRLEEGLAELFPGRRIARLDRDVARTRGAAQKVIDAAHAGDVDILVGTQMLAKGHDFRRLTLVVAVDSDGGLFSSDFRAPERMFATLMQVAGRAGRDPLRGGAVSSEAGGSGEAGGGSGDVGGGSAVDAVPLRGRVIVQTRFPDHPLFDYLSRHDFAGFADVQLAERREVGLPPYRFQVLLRAEAATQAEALAFLAQAKRLGESLQSSVTPQGLARATADSLSGDAVSLLDPVPMAMSRLAGRERAQLLVEANSRRPLHAFLRAWLPALRELRSPARWQLDVDPLEI
jgi:primosomal protein N' (replication factor Y)